MRRAFFLGLTGVILGAWIVVVAAAPAGSETKGRYYFKKSCKGCHVKKGEGGEISPLSRTQAQWKSYMAAGKHNKGTEQLTKYLTAEQLTDVNVFVQAHASDSPQPETCGK
jgi:mono/diheme cytochrome c family protein